MQKTINHVPKQFWPILLQRYFDSTRLTRILKIVDRTSGLSFPRHTFSNTCITHPRTIFAKRSHRIFMSRSQRRDLYFLPVIGLSLLCPRRCVHSTPFSRLAHEPFRSRNHPPYIYIYINSCRVETAWQ